jgi:hypothetical protein
MSEDDPFADLSDTLEDEPSQEDVESESDAESTMDDDSASKEQVKRRNPLTDSAFTYEEAQQRPFYAREETIADFDSWMKYELERDLNQRGYQNIVVRELTDALLRTVVEEALVPEVAERFEQARESATSESDK